MNMWKNNLSYRVNAYIYGNRGINKCVLNLQRNICDIKKLACCKVSFPWNKPSCVCDLKINKRFKFGDMCGRNQKR